MQSQDNELRRTRILDAAAELFAHFGFDKTSVSDLASKAGISKGSIYLHFDSKEQLFEQLLVREMETYSLAWVARIDADPAGGTIAGLYKASLHALSASPFMQAILTRDARVFGNYLRRPDNFFARMAAAQTESPRVAFVTAMQAVGAVRADVDAKVIGHVMDMLAYGLVGMDDLAMYKDAPQTQALIEGIGALMETALTPPGGGNSEAGKAIIHELVEAAMAAKNKEWAR